VTPPQLLLHPACLSGMAAHDLLTCTAMCAGSEPDVSAELEQPCNGAVVLSWQAASGAGSSSAAAGGEAVPPLAQARRAAVTLLRLQGQLLLKAKRMDEVRAGSRRV
jgi:hypothetical protein